MAMVLSTFIEIFGQKLAALIEEEVAVLFGAKGELKKLQSKLRLIENVLEDAEKKAFRDPAISHWADQLKHVMYDADDLIDEFRTKHLLLMTKLAIIPCAVLLETLFFRKNFRIRDWSLPSV